MTRVARRRALAGLAPALALAALALALALAALAAAVAALAGQHNYGCFIIQLLRRYYEGYRTSK